MIRRAKIRKKERAGKYGCGRRRAAGGKQRGRETTRRGRRQGGGGKTAGTGGNTAGTETTRRGWRQHGRGRRRAEGRQHGGDGGNTAGAGREEKRKKPETGRTAAGQKDGWKQKRRGRHEKSAAPDWGAALVANVPVDPHGTGSPAPLRTSVISPPRTRRPRAASRRSKHLRHCRPAAVRHRRRAAAPPGPAAGRRCPAKQPARRR